MATLTPVGYNTGSTISGTEQIGDLAIGTSDQDYSLQPGGVRFWMTPDQDLGYVIAKPVPSGNQPNQLSVPAYVGFNRSDALTDNSFISLSQIIAGQTLEDADEAKTWLNDNGYWTSWEPSGPTLLADLDASNSSSYPGTGTDWFDLVGSNDGVLNAGSGTISYGTTDGGEFTLNGGTNTRIQFADTDDLSLSTSEFKTYVLWVKVSNTLFGAFRATIMNKMSSANNYDGFYIGWDGLNKLQLTTNGTSTQKAYVSTNSFTKNQWYMMTFVCKISSEANSTKLYMNTSLEVLGAHGSDTITDNQPLWLGQGGAGVGNAVNLNGSIGELYVYERELSSGDITTLFNNTKTRFGH